MVHPPTLANTVHAPDKAELHLTDDASAVAAAIAEFDGPVTVVAHSYGGVPVTQGALSDQVKHLVYISAFVLDEGESLIGSVGGVEPDWWNVDGALSTPGTAEHPVRELFFADVPEDVAEGAASRLASQATAAHREPLTAVAWRSTPSTYIVTEQDAIFPVAAQEALAARAGSTIHRLPTSHSPFLSRPAEVAEIILGPARG